MRACVRACVLVGVCVTQAGLDIAMYLRGLWIPDSPACTSHVLAGIVANIGQFFVFWFFFAYASFKTVLFGQGLR